jgi:hypothetical protein
MDYQKYIPNLSTLIACLVIILIVMIYGAYRQNDQVSTYLTGMWNASDSFCQKSELDGMLLYIGPADTIFSKTRTAYLILYANNSVIVSKKIKIEFGYSFEFLPSQTIDITITLYDIDQDDNPIWYPDNELSEMEDETHPDNIRLSKFMPQSMACELSIVDGRMKWIGDDNLEETSREDREDAEERNGTLFAELFKDNMSTHLGESI